MKRQQLRIQDILKEKGITQKELAEKIGTSPSSLAQVIKGNISIDTLYKIAEALGVEITDLFKKDGFTALVDNKGELKKFDSIESLRKYINKMEEH
ncbi:MAG: helix-turn-helix transcriptional regulator [Bacteroidales bacterium]